MNVLLCGEFDAAEAAAWRHALCAALPQVRWLERAQALQLAPTVQAAVVARKRRGRRRMQREPDIVPGAAGDHVMAA
jgi:hypothetical protein